jgi:hypothetical protein
MKIREVSDSRLFRGFGRKIDEEGKSGCNYARIRGALSTVITKNLAFINISGFFFWVHPWSGRRKNYICIGF